VQGTNAEVWGETCWRPAGAGSTSERLPPRAPGQSDVERIEMVRRKFGNDLQRRGVYIVTRWRGLQECKNLGWHSPGWSKSRCLQVRRPLPGSVSAEASKRCISMHCAVCPRGIPMLLVYLVAGELTVITSKTLDACSHSSVAWLYYRFITACILQLCSPCRPF
jgi:hypothetical protein